MKDFGMLVAGTDDVWHELWIEIYYNNDIPVFIIQEEIFYEAILYRGDSDTMTLPLDGLITALQEAKIHLPGNEEVYMEVYNTNRELFESTKKTYLDACKIVETPLGDVEILHNGILLAKLSSKEGASKVFFYYHGENIRLPVEALQYLLQEAKKLLLENSNAGRVLSKRKIPWNISIKLCDYISNS